MIYAVIAILGLVALLGLIGLYLYQMGSRTQAAIDHAKAISAIDSTNKKHRKIWLSDIDRLATRRTAVGDWMRKNVGNRRI